jgi:hypothetical protein
MITVFSVGVGNDPVRHAVYIDGRVENLAYAWICNGTGGGVAPPATQAPTTPTTLPPTVITPTTATPTTPTAVPADPSSSTTPPTITTGTPTTLGPPTAGTPGPGTTTTPTTSPATDQPMIPDEAAAISFLNLANCKLLGYRTATIEGMSIIIWVLSQTDVDNIDTILHVDNSHEWVRIESIKHVQTYINVYNLVCADCEVTIDGRGFHIVQTIPMIEKNCQQGNAQSPLIEGSVIFSCDCLSNIAVCSGDGAVLTIPKDCDTPKLSITGTCLKRPPKTATITSADKIEFGSEVDVFAHDELQPVKTIKLDPNQHDYIHLDKSSIRINTTQSLISGTKFEILWAKHPIVVILMCASPFIVLILLLLLLTTMTAIYHWSHEDRTKGEQSWAVFKTDWIWALGSWWSRIKRFGHFAGKKTARAGKAAIVVSGNKVNQGTKWVKTTTNRWKINRE